jgi:hypothetical protein
LPDDPMGPDEPVGTGDGDATESGAMVGLAVGATTRGLALELGPGVEPQPVTTTPTATTANNTRIVPPVRLKPATAPGRLPAG